MVSIGVRRCSVQRLGVWDPLVRLAEWPSFLLAPPLGIGYLEHRLCWTRRQNGFFEMRQHMTGWPHLGSVDPVLYTTSFPRVTFTVTMPYFGHNEDMHGVLSIWWFSIIRCSWNGRSMKVVELVSNKHISSISWMKCRYVAGKYMHFMTTNRTFGPRHQPSLSLHFRIASELPLHSAVSFQCEMVLVLLPGECSLPPRISQWRLNPGWAARWSITAGRAMHRAVHAPECRSRNSRTLYSVLCLCPYAPAQPLVG
jgi:hypothetical protein